MNPAYDCGVEEGVRGVQPFDQGPGSAGDVFAGFAADGNDVQPQMPIDGEAVA